MESEMSEQAGFPPPTGAQMQQPPPYAPGQAPPVSQAEAQAAAAGQLAAAAEQGPGVDAGESLEQMQQRQREVLLPMEEQIQGMMAAFKEQQDTMAAQIAALQAQLATAQAAAGPPAVEQYAGGVATLVKAHADANPDLPRDVFAPALAAAAKLKEAATAAVTSRDTGDLQQIAGDVRKWATTFRGKHLDMSSLLADLDLLGEAATRLAA
jgi:hypothetical protein